MSKRGPNAAVDLAICRYLEALASTLPPSQTGRQLDAMRDGTVSSRTTGDASLRYDRLCAVAGPMRHCTREDLIILAARYWARTYTTTTEAHQLSTGRVMHTTHRRSACLAVKAAARGLGMTTNAYQVRLTAARGRVLRGLGA
jgi:hypothetical protein